MFNVFEHPWGLITTAIIISLILLIYRSISPEKYHWWLWLIPAFLILTAFGLDLLIETDSEKIGSVINTGVKAFENEDPNSIELILSDNYSDSSHSTKRAMMSHCRAALSQPLVEKIIQRTVSIDVQPSKATVIFTVRIFFDEQSYVYQGFKQQTLTEIKTELQKQPDGRWFINRVELLKIDLHPADWRTIRQAVI